jgi:hypothetical protein
MYRVGWQTQADGIGPHPKTFFWNKDQLAARTNEIRNQSPFIYAVTTTISANDDSQREST